MTDEIAPDFNLKNKEGKFHKLSDFKEKFIIIYFYPKDNTSGCTIESKGFNDLLDDFKKIDTKIVGISGGDEASKRKFCEKNSLNLLLLSDTEFKTSKDYGVYGEKSFRGKKFLGINRTTFILDSDRKIIKIFNKVKPANHSKEVLDFIKSKTI
jgi:thioredoxin-dependent peroxiredoxin